MNAEKYTDSVGGFIQSAQSVAVREGNQQLTSLHLLKVLLDDGEGFVGGLIDRSGGNSRAILRSTESALGKLLKVSGAGAGKIYLAPDTARNRIKLKRSDGWGMHGKHHHYVEMGFMAGIEGDKVRLSANADIAVTLEEEKSGRPVEL